jgi:glycerol kinase
VGFQTRDLLDAMRADWASADGDSVLRVDGGMSASNWAMQFLSDIIGAAVDRPAVLETTALGVAWLAGMRAGVYPDKAAFAESWRSDRQFTPTMDAETRETRVAAWKRAVQATLSV